MVEVVDVEVHAEASAFFDCSEAEASRSTRWRQDSDSSIEKVCCTRLTCMWQRHLVTGRPLDRPVLVGTTPSKAHVIDCAREGVTSLLAGHRRGTKRGRVPVTASAASNRAPPSPAARSP